MTALNPTLDPGSNRLGVIDCDVHPKDQIPDLKPYLSKRWSEYLDTFGMRARHGFQNGFVYPKSQPQAARRDSWPPDGGYPASNLKFMQDQLVDFYDMDYCILNFLSPTGQGIQNSELSVAMSYACNELHRERWTGPDKRLKASIVVPYEDDEVSRLIIDGHDTRDHALSLEDSLVKDADKLWRYTRFGLDTVRE